MQINLYFHSYSPLGDGDSFFKSPFRNPSAALVPLKGDILESLNLTHLTIRISTRIALLNKSIAIKIQHSKSLIHPLNIRNQTISPFKGSAHRARGSFLTPLQSKQLILYSTKICLYNLLLSSILSMCLAPKSGLRSVKLASKQFLSVIFCFCFSI